MIGTNSRKESARNYDYSYSLIRHPLQITGRWVQYTKEIPDNWRKIRAQISMSSARNYEQLTFKTGVISWSLEYAGRWCMSGKTQSANEANNCFSLAVALNLVRTKMFRSPNIFQRIPTYPCSKYFLTISSQGTLDRSSVPCRHGNWRSRPKHQRVKKFSWHALFWPSPMFAGIGGVEFSSLERNSENRSRHFVSFYA